MRRLCLAPLVLILAGCASTGPQTVAGLDHRDKRPTNLTRVSATEVAGASNCYGDGQTGPRVQAVYVVPDDRTDRYPTVAGSIRTWVDGIDQALDDSAQTQGAHAHFRWACTDGVVDVAHVNVTPAEDDSLSAVRTALMARGYDRTDRKYLIWADTTGGNYCGISKTYGSVDAAPTYSQVNATCWGYSTSVELHELVHGLGGVPLAAPNSNGSWHCFDDYDRMCYDDGSGPTHLACSSSALERLLDCNHDDYADFRQGSTLPGNIATSAYLAVTWGEPFPSPSPTDSPSPTVSPTASPTVDPSPTVTASPTPKACGKSRRPGCR